MNKTQAYLNAEAKRDVINSEFTRIDCDDALACVYVGEVRGNPVAKAYRGRSLKPVFFYRFKTEADRDERVASFFEDSKKIKKTRQATENNLEVGDVLSCSWGYEQTNIDYYLVIGLVGKKSVRLVQIGSLIQDGEYWATGQCVPDVNNIISEPFTKRVDDTGVKISSFQYASKKSYKEVAGTRIYSPDNWTAYA